MGKGVIRMGKKKWTNQEKKLIALELLRGEKTVAQVSKEYGVSDGMVYKWRELAVKAIGRAFNEKPPEYGSSAERDRLLKIIGEQTCVIETLKKISEKL